MMLKPLGEEWSEPEKSQKFVKEADESDSSKSLNQNLRAEPRNLHSNQHGQAILQEMLQQSIR